jgi:hypothetical protein
MDEIENKTAGGTQGDTTVEVEPKAGDSPSISHFWPN